MWPALIGAAASMAGSAMANAESRNSVLMQQNFQRDMSNSAHQREVADLRLAGLNPILSATNGFGGSSTPSGGSYTARDVVGPAVSSALQVYQAQAQKDLIQAQADREQASALKTLAEANLVPLQRPLLEGQTFSAFAKGRLDNEMMINQSFVRDLLKSQKLSEDSRARLNSANHSVVLEELKSLRNQGDISETQYGKILAFLQRGVQTIGPLLPWFSRIGGGNTNYRPYH